MTSAPKIESSADPALHRLCSELRQRALSLETEKGWVGEQLRLCGTYGVYEWFVPRALGGQEWSASEICRGYLELSSACLSTTFVITQYMGACQRIAGAENAELRARWLPKLISGEAVGTVGISHLTTSRRHLAKPVLRAELRDGTYILDGYSPWVTGADRADVVVVGATLDDGRQLLAAVPLDSAGIQIPAPHPLLALSASRTGPVQFHQVQVPADWLLGEPEPDIMQGGKGANTGGVQTSTLALGLAKAAWQYLERERERRPELAEPTAALRAQWTQTVDDLLYLAEGERASCNTEQLRERANGLALRATQAALVAAKGAGFVAGHEVGRWCREAMFFLVWSCPQTVASAQLCAFAGIEEN